jgi:AcrR family transcriptional regulator
MDETDRRPYRSSLRERQVAQTRDLILDALTELLDDRRVDEVTTRDIAARAGVSERTVYRHFPDRDALLDGMTRRVLGLAEHRPSFDHRGLDGLPALARRMMERFDEHAIAIRAEALLNADPRRFSSDTRASTSVLVDMVAAELPDLDQRDALRIAAVLRCLCSAQAWLRMREELGVPGTESGPVVAWVVELVVRELRAGRWPPADVSG